MSSTNRLIIRLCTLLVAGMCMYPPWNEYNGGHLVSAAGYALLISPPPDCRVDVFRLGIQIAVVAVLCAGFVATAPKDASLGLFADEREVYAATRNNARQFIKKHRKKFLVIIWLFILATGFLIFRIYEIGRQAALEEEQRAQKQRQLEIETTNESIRAAREAAESRIRELKLQTEEAARNDRAEQIRAELYKSHTWPVHAIPNSKVKLQFTSSLISAHSLAYRISLSGPADDLEKVPLYYSSFTARLLNRDGMDVGSVAANVSDLVQNKNTANGLVGMESNGKTYMDEQTYAGVVNWSPSWSLRSN